MGLKKRESNNPLWTRDFTIITLGSVISMFGNAMSGFAMSLLVLDYTKNNFLYAIYIAVYTLPQIIMPIISGAVLDRFSRKKTIYTLDFVSTGLYLSLAGLLAKGYFSFPILAAVTFIIGSINSVYFVAYESFYPLLITEGNYSKAYSISSVLETLSGVMIPVSTYFYKKVGIAPLLAVNSVCFLTAAIAETQIRAEENYIDTQRQTRNRSLKYSQVMLHDIREGFLYLWEEKGLLAVAVYFVFSNFAAGASSVVTLPYFKSTFENGEYIYFLVWGGALAGRAIGGLVHYRIRLPVKAKYTIALLVYIIISAAEGSYLYFPIPIMFCLCFLTGILGITSYTIRSSATQSYVPDEKKGRFNGAFNMLSTVGNFTGELAAGALAVVFSPRYVLSGFMFVCLLSAVFVIGGNRKAVSAIYNRDE